MLTLSSLQATTFASLFQSVEPTAFLLCENFMVTALGGCPIDGRLASIQADAWVPQVLPSYVYSLSGGEVGIRAKLPFGWPGKENLYHTVARFLSQLPWSCAIDHLPTCRHESLSVL